MDIKNITAKSGSWRKAFEIQKKSVSQYNRISSFILGKYYNGDPEKIESKFKDNIFSTLFITTAATLNLPDEKLEFYAVLNHCMRTLVTGCDNLFDDEYKEVIPLLLPGRGTIFKSVLHIIIAEKIIAMHLDKYIDSENLTTAKASIISRAALEVLLPSGIEEHEEEDNPAWYNIKADQLIDNILYRKTGVLFEAPMKLIRIAEDFDEEKVSLHCKALSTFGIACQMLDDVMDTGEDIYRRKYNSVVSLAAEYPEEKNVIRQIAENHSISKKEAGKAAGKLKKARRKCIRLSFSYFRKAHQLFREIAPELAGKEIVSIAAAARRQIMSDRNLNQ